MYFPRLYNVMVTPFGVPPEASIGNFPTRRRLALTAGGAADLVTTRGQEQEACLAHLLQM
jgi:hypothetical protein